MHLAILADIHGNLPALRAVLADVERQGDVQGIIVAGDHVLGLPFPAETMRLLRSRDCVMIRGNRDDYLLDIRRGTAPHGWDTSLHFATPRWTYERLDEETLDFIAALPAQRVVALAATAPIRVLHGSPERSNGALHPDRQPEILEIFRREALWPQEILPLDRRLSGVAEPVLVCAHTHIQWQQPWSGGLALNPGSVGESLHGDTRARYAVLHWDGGAWQADLHAVPYDLEPVRAACHATGHLAAGGPFARACLRNVETGHNLAGQLVCHVHRLARQAGFDGAIVPDEVWQQAEATFDWERGTPLA